MPFASLQGTANRQPLPATLPPRERREALRPPPPRIVARRGNRRQGRALESLGHAVEYLIDSRLFRIESFNHRDEEQAIQLLMRLSRAVFAECAEVVPARQTFSDWFARKAPRGFAGSRAHQD